MPAHIAFPVHLVKHNALDLRWLLEQIHDNFSRPQQARAQRLKHLLHIRIVS